ncbi:uncharacterized protein BDR25DRAFT_347553 [Lindgomyces ingoldianus]|uniref:Uncharacterized protein n=1 Tax=Lindgomyces ingoldianus TaxID=673940 RepID=A0ACB6Q8N2_9PLEO|nr:uncharacterized protein BDR25DRAFT_347553 [Lindgomyces ingoldianus]KAF2462895.1 hypothetical protein BDR25DRAFT_347553 [Lindgomyces ingoldianus]
MAVLPFSAFLISLLLLPLATYSSLPPTCYGFDGKPDIYPRQCTNSSMCCYLNRTDSYPDDECIQGLCLSHAGDMAGQYFVVACTDLDRKGGVCSAVWNECGNDGHGYTQATRCADNSWCCNNANITCCDGNLGFLLNEAGTKIVSRPRVASTAALSPALSATFTPRTDSSLSPTAPMSLTTRSDSPTPPPPSATASEAINRSLGLTTSDKIKIGLAVPGAVAGVAALGYTIYKWRTKVVAQKA